MKSTCSFGRGVKGGLVAGDSMTQLVICERMRLRFGMDVDVDMVTVVAIVHSDSEEDDKLT